MCGGARHIKWVQGQKRPKVNSKVKGLAFWAYLSGGAGLLIISMYFLFSDF